MISHLKRIFTLGLAGILLLLSLAGCSQATNQTDSMENSTGLTEITLCESWNFDGGFSVLQAPALHNGTFGLLYYLDNFYETLVRYENGEIVPGLAESWDVSPDGLTYTFTLQKGIQFSDGEELTAEVVKQNYDNMPSILGDSNGVFGLTSTLLDEVTVVDEYTVAVKLTTPYYGALQDFTLPLPMGIMSPNAFNEDGTLSEIVKTHTAGTGPYMYDGQKENDTYTFVRNPYYSRGELSVDIFHVKVIPDNDAKLLALRNGEIDLLLAANNMSYDAYQELSQNPDFSTMTSDTVIQTRILGINPAAQPFDDVSVRRAVHHAINKESICQNIFSSVEAVAESVMDPNLPFCDVDTGVYQYDPELAAELLTEAGWVDSDGDGIRERDGVKLSTSISCSSDLAMLEDVTAAVAADLQTIGFDVTTSSKETMTYYQDVNRGEYGIGIGITFNIPMDPFQFVANLRREPMRDNMVAQGLQSIPESDMLINSLYSMTDEKKIQTVYQSILQALHDDAVIVPLSRVRGIVVFKSDKISDYSFASEPDYYNIASINLK